MGRRMHRRGDEPEVIWRAYIRAGEFIKRLKKYSGIVDRQTLLTLKGQALAGDLAGAKAGLERIERKLNDQEREAEDGKEKAERAAAMGERRDS